MKLNKTKIIATLGPASSSKKVIRELIEEGVNVCRINFSHGSHEEHREVIDHINTLNDQLKKHTAILADLQGPKLRIGEIEGGGVKLQDGSELMITTDECLGSAGKLYINYAQFPKDVSEGDTILINDGKIILKTLSTNGKNEVIAKVIQGGALMSNKGINLPNTKISLPALTEKDRKDLEFALDQNVAWVGLSFVRSADDIREVKEIISAKKKLTKVVAKIEKPEVLDQIDEVIAEADALMVARGDLGVEIPMEDVPLLQKELVLKCRLASRPVIIATQMMETMIHNLSPTRAEVNDVANAVTDGADAVMLSGETAVGEHPVEVIRTMHRIITTAETYDGIYNKEQEPAFDPKDERFITDSICYNASKLVAAVNAQAIITNTFSGYTAFKISGFRPRANIFIFTANHKILNMLSLIWGVRGFYYDKFVSTDHTIADIQYILRKEGCLKENDLVINIASMPIADKGMSNMVKLSYVK